jgi:regulator of sigma E protease
VPGALGGLGELAVLVPGTAELTPVARVPGSPAPPDAQVRAAEMLERTGIESADMYVAFVPEASSEWRAGLRPGDRITALDGVAQTMWRQSRGLDENLAARNLDPDPFVLEDQLVAGADREHVLEWTRDGAAMRGTFSLRKEEWEDEFGQHYERYVFRTDDWVPDAPDRLVPNPHRFIYALRRGLEETASVIKFTSVGVLRLLQRRVPLSSVSGPITMYDIAGQAGAKGVAHFIWAMALLSVNLGIINLLPIPVLDGGHLLFFLIEGARRRPLPLRARELASLAGIVVLGLLVLVAFKNDVERRWDVIVTQVRELVS